MIDAAAFDLLSRRAAQAARRLALGLEQTEPWQRAWIFIDPDATIKVLRDVDEDESTDLLIIEVAIRNADLGSRRHVLDAAQWIAAQALGPIPPARDPEFNACQARLQYHPADITLLQLAGRTEPASLSNEQEPPLPPRQEGEGVERMAAG